METTILANGQPVGKFGSGSMKGIDQTALEGIGSIVGPKGGGKSPTHDVLVKWIERVIELAKKTRTGYRWQSANHSSTIGQRQTHKARCDSTESVTSM